MFDLFHTEAPAAAPGLTAPAVTAANPYAGPERRAGNAAVWHWLSAMLDEVDYGMLLLVDETHAVHVNHAARAELDARHPLQLLGRELRARRPQDVAPLRDALNSASRRGLRKLLTLGDPEHNISVSVVPLSALGHEGRGATLVILGKRQVCEPLSVQGYARSHGLTPAETRVLEALCRGARPGEITLQLGVAISTVRTQIGRSEERRVGKECRIQCRSRWSPYH